MFRVNKMYILLFLILTLIFSGCTSVANKDLEKKIDVIEKKVQAKKKSKIVAKKISTKTFLNVDKNTLEKAIINTMVDEEFYITSVNRKKGIINGMGIKDTLDTNFVTYFKENSDKSFSVTFNINTLGSGPYSATHGNLREKLLYEYLFSKLTNFISLENKIVDNKRKQKEILKSNQNINLVQKQTPSLVQNENKDIEIDYPFYSIQFISTRDVNIAVKFFKDISKKFKDARLEKLQYFFVVRLGKFNGYSIASNLYKTLAPEFKDAIIVSIKSKY